MRITVCCKRFSPRGGAEAFLGNFVHCLLEDGHRVRVIAAQVDDVPPGVQAVPLHLPAVPRALYDLALARASRKALAQDDADVTFSDQKCWGADVVRPGGGVQREYVRQRPRSYRGWAARAANGLARRLSIREWLRIYIDDKLYELPGPRCVVANSDMVRRELARHYPHLADRIRVVYNGTDTDRFSPALREHHRGPARVRLGIPQDAFVGVFVGHDWRRKGLYTFIQAVGLLASPGGSPEVYGVIVGRGREGAATAFARRCRAAERLRFVGPHTPDAFYGAADVFVLPSYYDPCANVTIEALACGLPVITSAFNGACELLSPGLNGFAVSDASDAHEVARCIRHFLDPGTLAAGSEAARAAALRHPLRRMYSEVIAVLEPLAAKRLNSG